MKSRILLIIAALVLGIPATLADTIPADTLTPALPAPHMTYRYFGEGMAVSSSAHTPFWLMNNRFGLSSVEKNNGFIRGGFFRETDPDTRFSWGFGADLVVPYNFTSRFVIQQLYGEVRYRSLQLTVGSKERVTGLVNSELASGSMVLSQNARPIPQAYLSMPRYEPVPFTNRWLSVKGYFSFGVTTDGRWQRDTPHADSRWVKNELFHSKGLFLRVGDPDRHPLTVEGGL
ncbi:MAG: capsule assembly Wzi family protein [Paramuribaculum sp.]|nr:capsule assembly Wzi family protein [Paramuribaculum sp.]